MNKISLAVVFIFLLTSVASAHSGRTNAEGCHNNKKTGDYHCHGGGSKSSGSKKSTSASKSSSSGRSVGSTSSGAAKSSSSTAVQPLKSAAPVAQAAESRSSSAEAVETLQSYARVIGSAKACGLETQAAESRVSRWIDQTFGAQAAEARAFFARNLKSAEESAPSQAGFDCDNIGKSFKAVPFP